MLVEVTHDVCNVYGPFKKNRRFYTFDCESNKSIGDVVLCDTKYGQKLGMIVRIGSKYHKTDIAKCYKINSSRRRELSPYNRARLMLHDYYISGGKKESPNFMDEINKIIKECFDLSNELDVVALKGFIYNEVKASIIISDDGKYCIVMATDNKPITISMPNYAPKEFIINNKEKK